MKKGGSSPKYIQKLEEGSPVIYSHTEEHMIRGKTDARSKTLSKKKASKKKASKKKASKKKASKKNASKKKASKKKKKQYAPADVDEALKAWWDSEAGREKKWKIPLQESTVSRFHPSPNGSVSGTRAMPTCPSLARAPSSPRMTKSYWACGF